MSTKISHLIVSALLLAGTGAVLAGNTGVQFASGVNAGNISSSSLREISGCAASRINDGIFWMHNDSGDNARIYAVSKTGSLRATYNLSGANAADYEDIAVGPGPVTGQSYIYVGDIGDNGAARNTKQVYRLAEPRVGSSSSSQAVERFNFLYPDGPRDAETLMVDRNGDVYVVSKRESSSSGNRVYRFKAPLVNGQTYTGVEVARAHISGLTGGDISADGSRILIKNGGQVYLWLRNDNESVGTALSRSPIAVPTRDEPQGEAVCWDRTGTDYYTISEGASQPFYYFKSLDSNSDDDSGGDTGDTPTSTNSLAIGKQLNLNQYIASSNGSYRFYLQGDGNLVLRNMLSGKAQWAAGTNGRNGVRLVMQGDGNLVLYTSTGTPVWATGTNGRSATYLIVQNDGNLVLYTASGTKVWASNTGDGSGGGTTPAPATLTDLFAKAKAKNGRIILDWDNTIDIDDKFTVGATAPRWMNAMAASGITAYLMTGNGNQSAIMNAVMKVVAPEHQTYWRNLLSNNAYYGQGTGNKDNAYMALMNGTDYSKWMVADDASANIADFNRITGGKGYAYEPNQGYALADEFQAELLKFVAQLGG